MIFTKNLSSIYMTCNRNYARELGIQPEELVGHTDYDFYPKDLADKYRADDRRIMESGLPETIEERHVQSGHEAWIHTVKTPIRNKDGTVCGVLGIFWDITERRAAAQRFVEQAALLDIVVDAVFVLDMQHTIVYWNKAAENIFRWSSAEAIGKNFDELLGTEATVSMNSYRIVLEKGEWIGEIQRKDKNGVSIQLEYRTNVRYSGVFKTMKHSSPWEGIAPAGCRA
jgi:PAS domain S-box-containing protein